MSIFQGLIKSKVEFPGVLVFGIEISKGCNTILQGWSFDLSGIYRGKVNKRKIQGGFQGSMSSTPPVWFFSGIAIFLEWL